MSRPSLIAIDTVSDRRTEPRLSAEVLGLDAYGRLTAGVEVRVVNLSPGGALLEQGDWLRPGTRTELRVTRSNESGAPAESVAAAAIVSRCWVHRLSPLRYRTALVFTGQRPMAGPLDREDAGEVEVVLEELSA